MSKNEAAEPIILVEKTVPAVPTAAVVTSYDKVKLKVVQFVSRKVDNEFPLGRVKLTCCDVNGCCVGALFAT